MRDWCLTPEQILLCEQRARDIVDLDLRKADYEAKVQLGLVKPKSTTIPATTPVKEEPRISIYVSDEVRGESLELERMYQQSKCFNALQREKAEKEKALASEKLLEIQYRHIKRKADEEALKRLVKESGLTTLEESDFIFTLPFGGSSKSA